MTDAQEAKRRVLEKHPEAQAHRFNEAWWHIIVHYMEFVIGAGEDPDEAWLNADKRLKEASHG